MVDIKIQKMHIMRNSLWSMIVCTVLMLSITSCSKEYFDQDSYEELIKSAFPVDNIDSSHDWNTITSADVKVSVNQTSGETYTVRVYEQDPSTNKDLTILAEGNVVSGNTITTSMTYPTVDRTFYVARIDGDGYRQVKSAQVSDGTLSVNFTSNDTQQTKETNSTSYFSWRYIFEGNFPQPGDYDFNDLVLTVTRQTDMDDPTTVYLTVSLDAIGTTSPIGAAIHISGLAPSDLSSIRTSNNFAFYQYSNVSKIKEEDNGYTTAYNGDVVIPLFNDAHYALSRGGSIVHGSQAYYYYNTVKDTSSVYYLSSREDYPAVVSYTIKCKSETTAKNITPETIDAFIVTQYNGAFWETHAAPYKKFEVLYLYRNSDYQYSYSDNYPWALQVPGNFKYPIEGTPIGKYKDGTNTGAYCISGHSFGEWAEDEDQAQDWYSYPSSDYVY